MNEKLIEAQKYEDIIKNTHGINNCKRSSIVYFTFADYHFNKEEHEVAFNYFEKAIKFNSNAFQIVSYSFYYMKKLLKLKVKERIGLIGEFLNSRHYGS